MSVWTGDRLVLTAASLVGVSRVPARFVAERGTLVSDGRGTPIMT
jgi:hypothetical protein